MLKYLVIILSDNSVSFCNYESGAGDGKLISQEALYSAIRFGMKENLMMQFVFPENGIPSEHRRLIDSIDHVKIAPVSIAGKDDIGVTSSWDAFDSGVRCETVIIHTTFGRLLDNGGVLKRALMKLNRINVVISDIDDISDADAARYGKWLERLAGDLTEVITAETGGQLNILTDRLRLNGMRNCNAGHEAITVAPDGHFYVCPAFYYGGEPSAGNLAEGIQLANRQLYELKNAPICRKCDAWHCRRCVWLNKRCTKEVNIPGHLQCVLSHYERNASRLVLKNMKNLGIRHDYGEIPELKYLDPFETLI